MSTIKVAQEASIASATQVVPTMCVPAAQVLPVPLLHPDSQDNPTDEIKLRSFIFFVI